MGDIVRDTTDFLGLTDFKGAEEARDQAKQQADRAYTMTKDEIEFQRQQYEDWKDIYGPIQEDLGTYFKNLTGDTLAAQQIAELQRASQEAQKNVDRQLAQRGLGGSGLQAQAVMQNQYTTQLQKANIRANADQAAAERKMGFLGLGLGQGTQMLGIQAGVSTGGSNVLGNMSNSALSNATSLMNSSTSTIGEVAGVASSIAFQ